MNITSLLTIPRRIIAAILIFDGVFTALLGFSFLDWQEEIGPSWYRRQVLPFFYRWPEPLLRVGGLVQAVTSALVLW